MGLEPFISCERGICIGGFRKGENQMHFTVGDRQKSEI